MSNAGKSTATGARCLRGEFNSRKKKKGEEKKKDELLLPPKKNKVAPRGGTNAFGESFRRGIRGMRSGRGKKGSLGHEAIY